MKIVKTERGFQQVLCPVYPPDGTSKPIVLQSSVILDYAEAMDRPGSSALWVGEHHHLCREEVAELISRLQHWLEHGRLDLVVPAPPPGPASDEVNG